MRRNKWKTFRLNSRGQNGGSSHLARKSELVLGSDITALQSQGGEPRRTLTLLATTSWSYSTLRVDECNVTTLHDTVTTSVPQKSDKAAPSTAFTECWQTKQELKFWHQEAFLMAHLTQLSASTSCCVRLFPEEPRSPHHKQEAPESSEGGFNEGLLILHTSCKAHSIIEIHLFKKQKQDV